MNASEQPGEGAAAGHKMHWHVAFTHFPISAFLASFFFMTLHMLTGDGCYSLGGYVSLIAGAAVMIPTVLTGWVDWKNRYKGARVKLFIYKIRISYAMMVISIALVIYQSMFPIGHLDIFRVFGHLIYFIGVGLLFIGAGAEGYYGGRLNHR